MEQAWAQHMLSVIEHAVDTLEAGPERIQQRLADAYQCSGLSEQVAPDSQLPPAVLALQLDLQATLETVHDAERGRAVASASRSMMYSSSSSSAESSRPSGSYANCAPGGQLEVHKQLSAQ